MDPTLQSSCQAPSAEEQKAQEVKVPKSFHPTIPIHLGGSEVGQIRRSWFGETRGDHRCYCWRSHVKFDCKDCFFSVRVENAGSIGDSLW